MSFLSLSTFFSDFSAEGQSYENFQRESLVCFREGRGLQKNEDLFPLKEKISELSKRVRELKENLEGKDSLLAKIIRVVLQIFNIKNSFEKVLEQTGDLEMRLLRLENSIKRIVPESFIGVEDKRKFLEGVPYKGRNFQSSGLFSNFSLNLENSEKPAAECQVNMMGMQQVPQVVHYPEEGGFLVSSGNLALLRLPGEKIYHRLSAFIQESEFLENISDYQKEVFISVHDTTMMSDFRYVNLFYHSWLFPDWREGENRERRLHIGIFEEKGLSQIQSPLGLSFGSLKEQLVYCHGGSLSPRNCLFSLSPESPTSSFWSVGVDKETKRVVMTYHCFLNSEAARDSILPTLGSPNLESFLFFLKENPFLGALHETIKGLLSLD